MIKLIFLLSEQCASCYRMIFLQKQATDITDKKETEENVASATTCDGYAMDLFPIKQTLGAMKSWGPVRTVRIYRKFPETALGISIVGGRIESISSSKHCRLVNDDETDNIGDKYEHVITGIFIKSVIPDSPAGQTGELNRGDHLVEVGNIKLLTSDQQIAVQAIKNAGNPIILKVRSLNQEVCSCF